MRTFKDYEKPMRILHIVTYMGRGGLETMLMNYYRNINRTKVQFDFLVHRDFEADYDAEIRSLGGNIYHISRLIPWSMSYRKELKRFFKEHPEYQIVHVHQDCLSSVALECAEECGIPVRIAHSHNSNQDKNWKYLVKKHYMKKIPTFATDLFSCGNLAGKWMFGGKEYTVLNNAIDGERYICSTNIRNEMRDELDLQDSIVIGHVGRFNLQKNHEFIIDVFFECTKLSDKVKLLLVGDGEEKGKIEEKVKKLGIEDKVIFTGVRSDVDKLMQSMDVFLFPSLYEGLPVTMIEAQAAGIPCIISNTISDECIVIDELVVAVDLKHSLGCWAQEVLKAAEIIKINRHQDIIESGYDIHTNVEWLENFYLQKGEV